MALNPAELSAITLELDAALRGAVVQNVYAPWERRAYLEVRVPGRSALLCLSAEPSQARLSVAGARPVSPAKASAFQQRLRALVIGARVTGFSKEWPSGVALALVKEEKALWLLVDWREATPHLALFDEAGCVLGASPSSARTLAHERSANAPHVLLSQAEPRFAPLAGAGFPWAEGAERHFEQAGTVQRGEDVRRAALQILKGKRTKLARTLQKVEAEAARGKDADEHQQTGELLAQNLHRLNRGQKTLELIRYTSEGPVEVQVRLDPKRSPKEEVAWRFHQAKRLRRGAHLSTARLEILRAELAALEQQRADLERAATDPSTLALPPSVSGAPHSAGKSVVQTALGYREVEGWGGARILVGKHGRGNDELTFRVARPHDLWVHVRGQPGSHVVVRLERGTELPQEVLLDAAHLAVHYSPAKEEERVEIQYASVRHIRKAKGGAPGQVIVTQEKTFVVRLEKERLRRLLHSA